VITLAQLVDLGLSERAVNDRVATGRLRRLHRGVFVVDRPSRTGCWLAAVLAVGGQAVLSHRSAAALWGLAEDHRATVDVTVPHGRTRSRPGIEIHRGEALIVEDVTVQDGIPCTALPRTLLNLAATVDRRTLRRTIDRAEELRLFDLTAIQGLLARSRHRRGAHRLKAALANHVGPTFTRSEAEERFLAVIGDHHLPHPEINAWIPLDEGSGYSPDFLWRDACLIVEIDGRAHHARRVAFEHDRKRDRRLALAGFETRRYAASEVFETPDRVAREVHAFLTRVPR
jgi:very-short-patch-repair endonuclease